MHFAFLGTSGALPSPSRDTTALVFVEPGGSMMIDCGGSPLQKLRLAGVDPLSLRHVIITHIHPDHAYGLPALVQGLDLLGRRDTLDVFCRREHVAALGTLLHVFGLRGREEMFTVALHGVDMKERAHVLATARLTVTSSPNDHGKMPNLALRVDTGSPEGAVVYSSDTAPCDNVVRLATGARTLVHEATFPHRDRGRFGVHSTALEAGEVAARAGVERLILTHIEADYHDELDQLAAEARTRFSGVVEIAQEFTPYPM